MPRTENETTVLCPRCGDMVEELRTIQRVCYPSVQVCPACFDGLRHRCDDCNGWTYIADLRNVYGAREVCPHCAEDYAECEDCGETFHVDDLCDWVCDECRRDGGDYQPRVFNATGNTYTKVGSERRYGLELETDQCDGHEELDGEFAFGAKDDCSVHGKEFYSAILSGDKGLDEIKGFCSAAKSKGWEVARCCGFHLHLDMTNESDDSLRAIAYAYAATRSFWHSIVAKSRRGGGYCPNNPWRATDVLTAPGFREFARRQGRDWINISAISYKTTFEVRLHQGTLNKKKVCNWVKAHTRFADWASKLGSAAVAEKLAAVAEDDMFDFIVNEVWGDEKLGAYYRGRRAALNPEENYDA